MPGCADEFSPKVIRSGMGTHFRLPFARMDWDEAEKWLRSLPGMRILAADSDGGISCWKTDLCRPTALIIGSEANGPCDRALALSDARILIPMPGKIESLNAGIAAGILLFEVVRQRSLSGI
jgi:TrmH family RNA methyltransferase